METLLFVLDASIVVAMCYMAMKDDRRPRGAPASSLFRFRESLGSRSAPARRFVPGAYRPEDGRDPNVGPRR